MAICIAVILIIIYISVTINIFILGPFAASVGPNGPRGTAIRLGLTNISGMPSVIVAVCPAPIFRDGIQQPGFIYISSNVEAQRSRNLGLYDVWKQPGVNPFPASIAEWSGTLAATNSSIDPISFEGDLRDLLMASELSYIVYHFVDGYDTGVDVYTQSSTMPRDCWVVYAVDIWSSQNWYRASRFDYVGHETDDVWL